VDVPETGVDERSDCWIQVQEAAGGGLLTALTSTQPGDDGLADYEYRIEHDPDASVQAITEHIGTRPHAFAHPFGAYGAERVNDPRIQGVLSGAVGARFTLGCEQDQQGSIPLAGCSGDRPAEPPPGSG
jgi:hypothetical protein